MESKLKKSERERVDIEACLALSFQENPPSAVEAGLRSDVRISFSKVGQFEHTIPEKALNTPIVTATFPPPLLLLFL